MPASALGSSWETESGMVRVEMVLPQKASRPIVSTPEEMVTEVRFWQLLKALSPIDLIELGMLTDCKFQQELKV